MRVTKSTRIVVDRRKLREYCLDPSHARGRHKARVLRAALQIDASHAEWLGAVLEHAARTCDLIPLQTTEYGQLFGLDVAVTRNDKQAVVRTRWIIPWDEDLLRFLTCYASRKS